MTPPMHRSQGAMSGGQFSPGYIHLILLKSTTIKLLTSSGVPFRFPRTRPTLVRIFPRLVTTEFTTLLGSLYPSSSEDTRPPAGLTKQFRKLLTNLRARSWVPTQVPTPTLGIRKLVLPSTVRMETTLRRIPFYDRGLTVALTTLVLPLYILRTEVTERLGFERLRHRMTILGRWAPTPPISRFSTPGCLTFVTLPSVTLAVLVVTSPLVSLAQHLMARTGERAT